MWFPLISLTVPDVRWTQLLAYDKSKRGILRAVISMATFDSTLVDDEPFTFALTDDTNQVRGDARAEGKSDTKLRPQTVQVSCVSSCVRDLWTEQNRHDMNWFFSCLRDILTDQNRGEKIWVSSPMSQMSLIWFHVEISQSHTFLHPT